MNAPTFKVESFILGPVQTNCYLLTITEDDGKQRGIIIDPGMNPDELIERIEGIQIEAILLTHAHFDHMGGVDEVRKLAQCPVYIHAMEADWLTDARKNGSMRWAHVTPPLETDPAEYELYEGQQLELINHTFTVMHTPGHSPGSVSFICGDQLFSGDVLFKLSVGRTDLEGSKHEDLVNSIKQKLYTLDDATIVYAGHGPKTIIGYEKINNPFVRA